MTDTHQNPPADHPQATANDQGSDALSIAARARRDPLRFASTFSGIGGFEVGFHQAGWDANLMVEINDHCRRVLARHFPTTPLMEDIRDVPGTALGAIQLLVGGFPCFPAGTLITTKDGSRPIEDVREGDLVLTHERRWRPVINTMNRPDAPLLHVRILGAPAFSTTDEHPFYARLKSRVWDPATGASVRILGEPQWVPAGELTRDHFVAAPIQQRDEDLSIGGPLAYLVGRWLGDGWIVDHARTSKVPAGSRGSRVNSRVHKAIICCAHPEAEQVAAAIAAAGYHATPAVEGPIVKFHISSMALVEFLRPFGRGAAGKHLAPWVFDLPAHEQQELLRGWSDADGSPIKARQGRSVAVSTISERLVHEMSRLVRSATGRTASVHRNAARGDGLIEGRTVNQATSYGLVMSERNREAITDGGFVWCPVREVTTTDQTSTVYNLGVEEDESYTAWGFTVHNCTDTSVAAPHRLGLAGARSGLFWEFHRLLDEHLRLVDESDPRWVVIENPEGLLTSNQGRDAAAVFGGLEDLGYGWAYRVVDGGHLGTAQRRRRVLVVGHRGGDPRPAWSVLGDEGPGAQAAPARRLGGSQGGPGPVPGPVGPSGAVIWRKSSRARKSIAAGGFETWVPATHANTLTGFDGGTAVRQTHLVAQGGRLRAFTPTEWERLQGFADGWTDSMPASARWTALGNAVHTGTAAWLARRLDVVHNALPYVGGGLLTA